MTDELVGRFDATAPQRIAASTQLSIVGSTPMGIEVVPAIGNRFCCVGCVSLHAPQASKYRTYFTQIQARHRRFDPLYGLYRCAVLRLGHLMEVLRTVVIVEHLTGVGKQRLDMFPDPRGAIAHDTQPHLVFGNQAHVFHLLEGFAKLGLSLHLMPTEQMD